MRNIKQMRVQHPRPKVARFGAGIWRAPLIVSATLVVVVLITISPLSLLLWSKDKGLNWSLLSNIGQTYNGASAVLAALALVGITASLIVQARQSRTDRIQQARDRQFQLQNLVLDSPALYGPILSAWPAQTGDELRRLIFIGLWANNIQAMFEMGTVTEMELRKELQAVFATNFGRLWWDAARSWWTVDHSTSKAERRFKRILREEYEATSKNVAVYYGISEPRPKAKAISKKIIASATAGLCAGVLAGSLIRRR
jgi:Family of unknown function (DUF6082)